MLKGAEAIPDINELRDQNKIELFRKAVVALPLMFGAGAGARALLGISPFVDRYSKPNRGLPSRTNVLHISATPKKQVKRANDTKPWGYDTAKTLATATGALNPAGKSRGLFGFLAGDHANSQWGIPAAAAVPAVGLAALGGGYKLTDWILSKTRKKELDSELDMAQQDYETALRNLGTVGKLASEDKFAAVTALAQAYEKAHDEVHDRAHDEGHQQTKVAVSDYLGLLAGTSLAGGTLLAAATGKMVFDHMRARDKAKVLNEAFRRRQQQLYNQMPFPTVAVLDEPERPKKRQNAA